MSTETNRLRARKLPAKQESFQKRGTSLQEVVFFSHFCNTSNDAYPFKTEPVSLSNHLQSYISPCLLSCSLRPVKLHPSAVQHLPRPHRRRKFRHERTRLQEPASAWGVLALPPLPSGRTKFISSNYLFVCGSGQTATPPHMLLPTAARSVPGSNIASAIAFHGLATRAWGTINKSITIRCISLINNSLSLSLFLLLSLYVAYY